MNFKELNIQYRDSYNTFIFNDKEIKVLKYLPIEDKFDLIMTAIQKSLIDGVYNPIRLEAFYNLNIIYLYTNLVFDIEDRIDEARLYDTLKTSGLLEKVLENIDGVELLTLGHLYNECLSTEKAYRTTTAAIIAKLVDDMPKNAEMAKNIVDNFDKEKLQEVLKFTQALKSET